MSYELGEATKIVGGSTLKEYAAGKIESNIIDRRGFYDAAIFLQFGTVSGAPTARAVTLTMQSGNMADGSDMQDVATPLNAAALENNAAFKVNLDLNSYGRYLRLQAQLDFTGGSSPKVIAATAVVLGNAVYRPVMGG